MQADAVIGIDDARSDLAREAQLTPEVDLRPATRNPPRVDCARNTGLKLDGRVAELPSIRTTVAAHAAPRLLITSSGSTALRLLTSPRVRSDRPTRTSARH